MPSPQVRPKQFVGVGFGAVAGADGEPSAVVLRNNGLHIILEIDRTHRVGKTHAAGLKDVVLEAALTSIADCEDSVAAVDGEDKAQVYGNWTNLMKGTLEARFMKGGKENVRTLNEDRVYDLADGSGSLLLPGRSIMLVRNVGIHMYTDAAVTASGDQVPEGMLDAMVTICAALHDVRKARPLNSRARR